MNPYRYLDGDADPVDDRCPDCGREDCRCEQDAEDVLLAETVAEAAAEREATDAAYRAWAAPVVRLLLRRAA